MVWSVTRLAGTQWCERQAWLQKKSGKRVQTLAMAAGSTIHEELEKEIHEVATIRTQSAEDRVAVHLLNLMQSCSELLSNGVTRETPVWTQLCLPSKPQQTDVHKSLVFGIIDEIALLPATSSAPIRLSVRDSKTRSSGRLPSESAQRSGKLQLQIYSFMLEQFITSCGNHVGFTPSAETPPPTRHSLCSAAGNDLQWLVHEWTQQGLDLHAALSEEVCSVLTARGLAQDAHTFSWQCLASSTAATASPAIPSTGAAAADSARTCAQDKQGGLISHIADATTLAVGQFSLGGLLEVAALAGAQLPPVIDNSLELVYRRQRSSTPQPASLHDVHSAGSIIGVVRFPRKIAHMQACVRRALLVYSGAAEARPVPEQEWHKCKYCAFVHECGSQSPMVAKLGMPPADWVPEGHDGAVVLHRRQRPPGASAEATDPSTYSSEITQQPLSGTLQYDSDGDVQWAQAALQAVIQSESELQQRQETLSGPGCQ